MRQHPLLFVKSNLTMSWLPILGHRANARQVMFRDDCPDDRIEYCMRHLKDESFLVFLDMIGMNLPDAKKMSRPLMIVGAEKDYLVPLKDTLKMAKAYGKEPYIIRGASHNFFLESGWEPTATAILKFIES
jgi:pimeloyl-ACP methyl ester carboxylesterase